MREYILACSCSGVPEKAQTSYKIMFPEREKIPEVYKGKDKIMKLAEQYQNTNFYRYAQAIAKKNGQYAHYIKTNDKQDILENYNLLNGRRVA